MEEKKNENIEKLEDFVKNINNLTNDLKAAIGNSICENEGETAAANHDMGM